MTNAKHNKLFLYSRTNPVLLLLILELIHLLSNHKLRTLHVFLRRHFYDIFIVIQLTPPPEIGTKNKLSDLQMYLFQTPPEIFSCIRPFLNI